LSRALAKELSPVIAALAQDRVAREIFVRPDGTARKEGDAFHQTDLAETLSVIRSRGPEELYRGPLAKKFVAGVRAAGGTLTLDELKAYKPRWRRAVRIQWGSNSAFFPPPPAAAGMVEAQTLGMLIEGDLFDDSNPADFAHALAETEMRAYADRARWLKSDNSTSVPIDDLVSSETLQRLLANFSYDHHVPADQLKPPPVAQPENPSATGFVTFDREGSAAACALTMNNSFGTGRFAGDTGILLAANPDAAERGPLSLGPMIVVKHNTNQLVFAAAAGGGAVVPGGVAAPTALINVAARTLLGEEPLEKAIAAKRIHHGGNPDLTYHEPGFNADAINVLRNRGHRIAATRNLGLVNAMSCPDGLPRDPTTCVVRTDPRGSGLAVLLER
jgi:gamma-glutamyltranspeptidase/glutathione hydrolase